MSQDAPIYPAQRLHRLFEPRSIALIGASDKSGWSWAIHNNLQNSGFGGRIYYVNPRAQTVHGQPTVARLADIGEPVDLGFLMVSTAAVLSVLQEMVDAGIHNAVILTSGFGELEGEGVLYQQELAAFARTHDLAIIGPNCMGFINIAANVVTMPTSYPPVSPGGVAIISHSGALASSILNFAYAQNVGLKALINTGNEAVLSASDIIDYFLEDEATTVIALFLEAIRDPQHFLQAARRALQYGKPIVAFKIGDSPLSAQIAQAHTGALVGDDRVIDAVFRQNGIIRVASLEELIITAGVLAQTGILPGNRLGFVGVSGGACDIAANVAESAGIVFPSFAEETRQALQRVLPIPTKGHNPFDATGLVVNDKDLFRRVLACAGKDPNIDVLVSSSFHPAQTDSPSAIEAHTQVFIRVAEALRDISYPAFTLDHVALGISETTRELANRLGLHVIPGGLNQGLTALGRAMWWSERVRLARQDDTLLVASPSHFTLTESTHGTWSEAQARTLLQEHGIPVVPTVLAHDAQEAIAAAHALGWPVVLKIVSADIVHKSDIGGVRLNLHNEDEVNKAFTQIMQAAAALTPSPRIDGVLVSPMRSGGLELLVGIVRDAAWGLVMAVGLGGIWVEVLNDTSLRVLPVSREDVYHMLEELQGSKLLHGARGTRPADLPALVEIIGRISTLAQSLGSHLESLEINPLRVDGSQIEVLDALVMWQSQ